MTVKVDVSPGNGGTVEIDGDAPSNYPDDVKVARGDYIQLEAVPASGYHFVEWGEPTVGSENPVDVRVISNMRMTAHFASDTNEFTSEDEMLKIIIPEETDALDEEGDPLTSLEFIVNETPPLPQEGDIVGLAYNLEPRGATFDPPVALIWEYEPSDVPSGVAEEDLVIAYYDEVLGKWVELESELDWANIAITALVDHLTTFAILAPAAPPPPPPAATFTTSLLSISPSEVNIGDPVSISVLLTNTGEEEGSTSVTLTINGVEEENSEITLAGGGRETIVFTTSRDGMGTYSVDVNGLLGWFRVREAASPLAPPPTASTPSSGVNWAVVAPIIGAVFLAIFLPIRLRRRRGPLDW